MWTPYLGETYPWLAPWVIGRLTAEEWNAIQDYEDRKQKAAEQARKAGR